MTLTSNITAIVSGLLANIGELDNPETVSRAAAAAVLPELRERIHERGEKPDGSKIGTYSNAYLRLREREGKTSDPNVIISFTRALQNGYTLAAADNGYTIGNISPDGDAKVGYMIDLYGDIWKLSEVEQNMALIAANETAKALLNK
jgi:hypothetical protein